MKKFLCIIAALVLIPFLSSCATYRPAPPPLQVETVGAPPYAGAVWVGGYWTWIHGGYVWVPGHWSPAPPPVQAEVIGVAPYAGAVWVGGHWAWRPRHGGYVWIRGHWRGVY